jgi:hypothetical protein
MYFSKIMQAVLFLLLRRVLKIKKEKIDTFLSEVLSHIQRQIRPSFKN